MLNMYLTGGVHFIDRLGVTHIPELLEREDFQPAPFLATYFYRVNVTRPPLDDVRVRRALSLALDRRTICERVLRAGQRPARSLVPSGMPGYVPAQCAPEDLEEARALLAEAGYGSGGRALPPIEILYNTSEAHRDIALIIADRWRRTLGVEAGITNQEWKVYLDTQASLDYDLARACWIGDYADPSTFLDVFVSGGENNKTGWSHAGYDRLLEEARREVNPERRGALYREAESILMEELPILPIYEYVSQNLVAPRLGGFYPNFEDTHLPKFWYWMEDEEFAARRASRSDERSLVPPRGPAAGKYPPAAARGPGS
jgi:oligopeptide transport system substrate-binding protein